MAARHHILTAAQRERKARRRRDELAAKEALGQATPAELAKLERYAALIRWKGTPGMQRMAVRRDYMLRMTAKVHHCIWKLDADPHPRNVLLMEAAGRLHSQATMEAINGTFSAAA